jgi:hypothetical protein
MIEYDILPPNEDWCVVVSTDTLPRVGEELALWIPHSDGCIHDASAWVVVRIRHMILASPRGEERVIKHPRIFVYVEELCS